MPVKSTKSGSVIVKLYLLQNKQNQAEPVEKNNIRKHDVLM